MYYVVETDKSFEQAAADLEAAVTRHGFGVLHVHDLGQTLRSKGIAFEEQCRILEVCNPVQAARILSADMLLNMALPCRISVFTEGNEDKDRPDSAGENVIGAVGGCGTVCRSQKTWRTRPYK